MIRRSTLFAVAAAFLLAPFAAQAAGISVVGLSSSGGNTSLLQNGDILTIDLVVDNATNLDVYGLGVGIRGYDPDANGIADNGLAFLGGSVSGSLFNDQAFPGPFVVGGIDNVHGTTPIQRGNPYSQVGFVITPAAELHAILFEGVSLSPSNGDGTLDIGVGGDLVGNGDIHFQVQFQASTAGLLSPSTLDLVIGNDPEIGTVLVGAGGVTLPFTNQTISVTIVPEPGTALLVGLGLVGLAARRR